MEENTAGLAQDEGKDQANDSQSNLEEEKESSSSPPKQEKYEEDPNACMKI